MKKTSPPPPFVPEPVSRISAEHFEPGTLGIAVFGPGKGEAIVVRLPDKRIGIVDGCREPQGRNRQGRGDPVRELLADFATQDNLSIDKQCLTFVCLTHPHDDHYAGLGRLMRTYSGRIEHLWMPPDSCRYMQDLLTYFNSTRDVTTDLPDVSELAGLARVIEQQDRLLAELPPEGPLFSQTRANTQVMKKQCGRHTLTISVCSPTDRDIHFATRGLAECIKNSLGETETSHYNTPDPNAISASLLIRWGKVKILLAGDLLLGRNGFGGWADAAPLIQGPVQVVNVANHASREAHDTALWGKMNPDLAIVTPFRCGARTWPPRPDMIEHLASTDAKIVMTAPPSWSRAEQEMFAWDPPLKDLDADSSVAMKNNAISATKSPGHDDRHNAVAVSLKPDGSIARLVLGGRARIVSQRDTRGESEAAPVDREVSD